MSENNEKGFWTGGFLDSLVKVAIIIFLITAASVMRDWVKIQRHEQVDKNNRSNFYFDRKSGEYKMIDFNVDDMKD